MWLPDVVSLSRVLQTTVIFGTDVVSFGGQNVSFGMLVAFNLASGDHLGVPGLDFCRFREDVGTVRLELLCHFELTNMLFCLFSWLFPV